MAKIARKSAAGVMLVIFGALGKRFLSTKPAPTKRRRGIRPADLRAAYARASRDATFMATMREVDKAFDCTTADGLQVAR